MTPTSPVPFMSSTLSYLANLSIKLSKLHFESGGVPSYSFMNTNEALKTITSQTFSQQFNCNDEILISNYINEIWLGEFPLPSEISVNTHDVTDCVIEEKRAEALEILTNAINDVEHAKRVLTKIENLYTICRMLFMEHLISLSINDIELVKKIHMEVGKNIINDAGQFRTQVVSALGSNVVYCLPQQIENRLKSLLSFCENEMKSISEITTDIERTAKSILLASLFLSEFLLIHPFSNGNGRIARLLINFILKDITFVPVSLFYLKREYYIQALELRNEPGSAPNAVAFFVLQCVLRNTADIHSMIFD